jgi:hypothetical protein
VARVGYRRNAFACNEIVRNLLQPRVDPGHSRGRFPHTCDFWWKFMRRLCAMAAFRHTVAAFFLERRPWELRKSATASLSSSCSWRVCPDQRIHNERAYHTTPDNVGIGRPGCPSGSVLAGCGEALSAWSGHCSRRRQANRVLPPFSRVLRSVQDDVKREATNSFDTRTRRNTRPAEPAFART